MNRYIALNQIVELGSFTRAADLLGYTQSAISQMIKSLEDELSFRLLTRSRVGVKLTPEGEEFYPYVQRAVIAYRDMLEKSKEIKGLDTGIIRIGTFTAVSSFWLPGIIKNFQALYPYVQFTLRQGDYSSIQQWIRTGEVDFGFLNPKAATDLSVISLHEGELMSILPCDHPLSQKESVTLEELSKEPFLLLEEGSYNEILDAFAAKDLKPDVKLCVHDAYSISSMVETGLGVSILSRLVLSRMPYKIVVKPINPPITRKIGIAFQKKRSMPIASRYFIDYLKKNLPD